MVLNIAPMTIQQAQQAAITRLQALYEVREAGNIADWLMEHLTGKKKIERMLSKHDLLDPAQQQELQVMLDALATHQPIQYVLGEAWFAGLCFFVNEHVLIPRPETEELVEWILEEKKNQVSGGLLGLLDIGTGSGCIPISLKHKWPALAVSAIDVSRNALAVAQHNAERLGADVRLSQLDILDREKRAQLPVFNIIVSNPPYIKQSEEKNMSANVLAFEPSLALFVPDEDALLFYREIAAFAKTHLAPHGILFFEINEALGNETMELLRNEGFEAELRRDLQGKDRMIRASIRV